jgi:16S rRNA (cytidine1402-2'-O)-methyltransferase
MPCLYVVATPIGNLSDLSPRARDTLAGVRCIAAEDTRVTAHLLTHFGIQTPMVSMHRHNEAQKAGGFITRMIEENFDAALVCDAGTPTLSDPGHLLVAEAVAAGVDVQPIAGPSAVAAALSISGFDAREFAFYGFLPRETGDLRKKLLTIARGVRVAVLYESPHRVTDLMACVAETLPGCRACVCCDLTKRYEKTLRGEATAVLAELRDNPKTNKGEYCVVLDFERVALPEVVQAPAVSIETRLLGLLFEGMERAEALERVVAEGARPNEAKRAMLKVREFLEG